MPKAKGHTSLKAQLLLDGGNLHGSYFSRTVVLVCEHGPDGALGLILNRASENVLHQVFNQLLPTRLQEERLFLGGPVQTSSLSFLHSDALQLSGNVMTNVSISHELDELVSIGEAWAPSQRLRVFAGYAGWAPGQLDEEMERSAWLVHPATLELIFDVPADGLWRHVLRSRNDWKERLLAEAPDDSSWN